MLVVVAVVRVLPGLAGLVVQALVELEAQLVRQGRMLLRQIMVAAAAELVALELPLAVMDLLVL